MQRCRRRRLCAKRTVICEICGGKKGQRSHVHVNNRPFNCSSSIRVVFPGTSTQRKHTHTHNIGTKWGRGWCAPAQIDPKLLALQSTFAPRRVQEIISKILTLCTAAMRLPKNNHPAHRTQCDNMHHMLLYMVGYFYCQKKKKKSNKTTVIHCSGENSYL